MQAQLLFMTLVGIGGLVGSVARYIVTIHCARWSTGFPLGTVAVNVVGCFIIAIVATLAEKTTLISPEMRLLLTTGFCGGFTTFSSLMYEVAMLLRTGTWWYVSIYVAASVIGGMVGLYLGMMLVNKWV